VEVLEMGNRIVVASLTALLLCGCAGNHGSTPDDQARPRTVSVGSCPEEVLLLLSGDTLLVRCTGDHTISIIGLTSRRETRRIRFPVTEFDSNGEETYGYLSGMAVDEKRQRGWAVSTEGQVFSFDLPDGPPEFVETGCDRPFSDVEWDPVTQRLLLAADEEGWIGAYDGSSVVRIAESAMPVVGRIRVRGSRLYYCSTMSGVVGEGVKCTAVGRVALSGSGGSVERVLERGFAMDIWAGPGDDLCILDWGAGRLLHLTGDLETRSSCRIPHGGADFVVADARRVLVGSGATPVSPVLEYRITDGEISRDPVREYPIPAAAGGLAILPDGGIAVAVGGEEDGRVCFLDAKDGRPVTPSTEP
jgi:hypothetical protein